MRTDLTRLTRSQLLQLLNGTPLGTVLTRSRLRRQMDTAAGRIGDGKTIHLLKYVRWLILAHDRPRATPADYAEARRRQAERNRAATKAGQDVGPIPDVQDMRRRQAAEKSLRTFCETYFAETFSWPWSDDHLKVIATIERVITDAGLFAFAMPRGSGKTCLVRIAALWASLTGRRTFVCLIGGSKSRGRELMAPLRMAILENPLLLADWPESIHPLRALENSSKRQLQQHVGGRLTHVRWSHEQLVFPTLAAEDLPAGLRERGLTASPSGGAVISVTSLDSNIRGQHHARPDGTIVRPSLVFLDDPQTRESARSPSQTKFRLDLLHGDVLPMAGPGQQMSAMLTCTKMYAADLADQLLDRGKFPDWQGECTRLVQTFPTNTKLWEEYAAIRSDALRRGKGLGPATKFYREHRKAMDLGAKVAWPARYTRGVELSAIQHAMNLRLLSPDAFAAEYQNEPVQEQISEEILTPRQVTERCSGRARGSAPLATAHLTAAVDVHDRLLYWIVCAWLDDFTGYVVDYGTEPEQSEAWFDLRSCRHTLRRAHPGIGGEGAVQRGLEELVARLLNRAWPRQGGGVLRIERLLVDSGYKPALVGAVKHKVGGSAMMLSRGMGIGARNRPISQYRRKPGEKYGHHWYTTNVTGTSEFPHVQIDVNYWKSAVHAAFITAPGEPGSLTLFGRKADAHQLLAEHIAASESWVETFGRGRVVHEWRQRANRPDNHWFDCLVACACAAAMVGAASAAMRSAARPARKMLTQADFNKPRTRL